MASSRILCDLCHAQNKDISGVMWCPDCDETLCTGCTLNHQFQKATKSHKLVDVNFRADLPVELSNQQECTVHPQLQVEYYCSAHDVICCRACLAEKHRSCDDVITLDIACQNDCDSLLDELNGEMKNIDITLKNMEDELNKNTSVIKTESTKIEQKIAQAKAKAIQQINQNQKTLLSDLQSEQRRAERNQNETKRKIQHIAEKLVAHSNVTKFVKGHGNAKQGFLVAHNLKTLVEKMHESVSDIVKNAMVTTLSFDETKDLIPCIPSLGRLTKSEQPSQVKYTPIKEQRAQCIIPKIDKPITSFRLTSTFKTSNDVNILGMVATEDNKLLLCNFTDKREVLVYNDNGQYVSAIILQNKPRDIAVIPGGDQYVVTLAEIKSIQYINSKELKPGRSVKLPADYSTRSITADKQYIYVDGNNEIFLLNHEGTIARKISLGGYIDNFVINDNKLYVSFLDQIYCHSIVQNKTIYQTRISGVITLRTSIVDKHGYIYFGEEEFGKLHRFNHDLKENMTIGDESVTRISAICFNTNFTKLFVANERGKTIAVFSCS